MPRLARFSSKLFTILGKISGAAGPTFTVTPSTTSISEGSTVTFTVTITGASDGTYYLRVNPLTGSVVVSDFQTALPPNLTLAVAVSGGSGSLALIIQSDSFTEASDTFNVSLISGWGNTTVLANSSTVTIVDAIPPNAWNLGSQYGGVMGSGETLYPDFMTNTWPYWQGVSMFGPSAINGLWLNQHSNYQSTVPYSGNALLGNGVGGGVMLLVDQNLTRMSRFNFPYKDLRWWNRQTGWDFQNENYQRLSGTGGYHISPNPAVGTPRNLHVKRGGKFYYTIDYQPTPHNLRLWHGEFGLEGPSGVQDSYYINVGGGLSWTDNMRYYSFNPNAATYSGLGLTQDGTRLLLVTNTEMVFMTLGTPYYVSNASVSFGGDYYWPYRNLNQTSAPIATSLSRGMFWKPDGTGFFINDPSTSRLYYCVTEGPWNIGRVATEFQLGTSATQFYTTTPNAFNNIWINSTASVLYAPLNSVTTTYTAPGTSDALQRPAIGTLNLSGWTINSVSVGSLYYLRNFWMERLGTLTGIVLNSARTKLVVLSDTGKDCMLSYTFGTAGDITTLTWDGNNTYPRMQVSTSTGGYTPGTVYGITFNAAGTKMYILGLTQLVQFNLLNAWEPASGEYAGRFTVSTQDAGMRAIYFRDDGNFYLLGLTNDRVYAYTMSGGDVSTASYTGTSFLVSGQETNGTGLFFRSNGAQMYVLGTTNRIVRVYDLSTAWNISTAVYNAGASTRSVAGQTTTPAGLFMDSTGTYVYIGGLGTVAYQYSLSIAWNFASTFSFMGSITLTNASQTRGIYVHPSGGSFFTQDSTYCYKHYCSGFTIYSGYSQNSLMVGNGYFDIPNSYSPLGTSTQGGIYSDDGLNFLVGYNSDLAGFTCSAAWNLSTMGYYWNHARSTTFPTTYISSQFRDLSRPSGNTSVLLTMRGGYIEKWTTTALLPQGGIGGWLTQENINTTTSKAEYVKLTNFNATELTGVKSASLENNDNSILLFNGLTTGYLWKFDLATPKSFIGMSASTVGDVNASLNKGPAAIRGAAFNSTGNVLYLADTSTTDPTIYRHQLNTPYNLSTTTFPAGAQGKGENFSNAGYFYFGTANGVMSKIRFKSDGTRFYINNTNTIFQYDLGTAWEISTAVAGSSYTVTPQTNLAASTLADFWISSDGSQLLCLSTGRAVVGGFTFGTAWDVATLSRTNTANTFSFNTQVASGTSYWFWFGRAGRSLIMMHSGGGAYKYEMSTAYDTTTCSYVNAYTLADAGGSDTGSDRTVPQNTVIYREYDDQFGPYDGIGFDLVSDSNYYFPFGTNLTGGTIPGKLTYWWALSSGFYPGGFWWKQQRYTMADKLQTQSGSASRTAGMCVEQDGTRIYICLGARYKIISYRTYNPGGAWNYVMP